MKQKLLYAACILFCLISTGCAGFEAANNRDRLTNLEVGMSKDRLLAVMGKPYLREAQGEYEWWFYLTDIDIRDNAQNLRVYTPVALKDGKIDGWGRNFYEERAKKYDIKINQTIENK
jgi:outer membrane protein assembly factor BamE (lipoprotein component of BamABCDE complex)